MKTITRLSVLTVLTVFLAACSQTAEYTNAIPADATAVISINLESLGEKAGVNDKDNEGAKQKLVEAMKSGMNAAAFEQLEKIMKNPDESGIDVSAPFYVFSASSFTYPAIVGKVGNEKNLQAALDVMAKEQICQPVTAADGYSFTTLDGGILAFNSTTLLIVTSESESAKEGVATLMKQTADNSIAKTEAFKKMEKYKGDVNFLASMAAIPAEYRSQISMSLPDGVKPEDMTVIGGLGFEKGKIALKMENYTENKVAKELMEKQKKAFKKNDGAFDKNFPASTLMYLNLNVNGEEFYNLLKENKQVRSQAAAFIDAEETKEVFNSLDGDISFGVLDVTMNSAPKFAMYAQVKDSKILETLYKNKESLGLNRRDELTELSKDTYVYKTKGMNVYLGIVKGNQLYVTTDEALYRNIGKAADQPITEAPYASEMSGKYTFFAINAESILALPIVKMAAGFGGKEVKTYLELLGKVSYLSVSSDGETSEVNLCLKDKDVNALKQIVDFGKQFAGM